MEFGNFTELCKVALGYYDNNYSKNEALKFRKKAIWKIKSNYGVERAEFVIRELKRKPDELSPYLLVNLNNLLK